MEENEERGLKTGVMCLEKNKDNYKGEVLSLGNTLEEVGKKFNITRERVRQIEKKTLDKLRIKYSDQLREYLR